MTFLSLARHLAALFIAAAVAAPLGAQAQAYPSKPVRMIVNFPPGGSVDFMGRLIAQKLSEVLGQPVVVENRAGASGNIGAEAVAAAPADGYTLLMTNGATLVTNPHLYRNTPFDTVRDFVAVTQVARISSMLVVHPGVPMHSAQEFLAYARANPGKLSYGSAGNGSGPHITTALMNKMANVSTLHIPYKGIQPAIGDLVAGQTQFMFADGGAYPFVQAGKLRVLAVASANRLPALPGTPTLAEAGVPGFHYDSAHTLAVRAGTPKEVVALLNAEVVKILRTPDVSRRIEALVAEVIANSSEQATAATHADFERTGKLIKEMGIRGD
jgi:tripartite-type tricarboxylate transporter receptor subunit TctC